MRGISIFQKPHYREFRTMGGRPMRGLPVNGNIYLVPVLSEVSHRDTVKPITTTTMIKQTATKQYFFFFVPVA